MVGILIRGAGVAGLATAQELAERGFNVEIIDRAGAVGQGASHFAGGMLAPFCERETAGETVLSLGLQAADWWEAAVPGSVTRQGTLVLAPGRDVNELSRFAARTTGFEWVDEAGIAALEPDLRGRFRRGLFFADEAHLDPRTTLADLARRLHERGARFHLDTVAPPDRRSHAAVIDCTGPQAIGKLAGLRGVRGEMLVVETFELHLRRPVRLLHPRYPIYLVPRSNGRVMIGATMLETEDDGAISVQSLMELLNVAYALHPAFAKARLVETGVGLRPAFPDNLPRVVETDEGLAIAGMHRHGFLLAPAMARQTADLLLKRLEGDRTPSDNNRRTFR